MNEYNHKLILGTAQFGMGYGVSNIHKKKVSENEVMEILSFAFKEKVETLDTATAYGDSELILGRIGVKNFNVITKLPKLCSSNNLKKYIMESAHQSLLNLNLSSLYGLLVHNAESMLTKQGEDIYKSVALLKEEGLVKKIGVSVYHPNEIEMIMNHYDFDIVQAPFNVIDRRLIDSGMMTKMNSMGVELHVRSIFLQGLLLMNDANRPKKFSKWDKLWNMWNEWLNDSKITATEACLSYALSFNEISNVLVGVDSLQQLQEICSYTYKNTPKIPVDISEDDAMLLNPSNWR